MSESQRDRMYREAMEAQALQQAAPQQAMPEQVMPQQVAPQPQFQAPPQVPSLSIQDKMRLRQPYMEYVTTEQVAGRQPKEMEDWAIDMSQGR